MEVYKRIKSLVTHYDISKFDLELVARIPELYSHESLRKDEIDFLDKMFSPLIDYWKNHIEPDIKEKYQVKIDGQRKIAGPESRSRRAKLIDSSPIQSDFKIPYLPIPNPKKRIGPNWEAPH